MAWRSNPAKAPCVLAQKAVTVVLLSSGNINATGVITGLTALPNRPMGVVQVYCFAQLGLVTGLYYATFFDQFSCQLWLDAAATIKPSGITAGAYTPQVGVEAILATTIMPGGAMGLNGSVRISQQGSCPNNANAKVSVIRFGGTTVGLTDSSTTTTGWHNKRIVRNRGASNSQLVIRDTHATAIGNNVINEDTSVDLPIQQRATIAVATDYVILEGYIIEVLPGE